MRSKPMPKQPRLVLTAILYDTAARLYRLYFQRGKGYGKTIPYEVKRDLSADVEGEKYTWRRVETICAGWRLDVNTASVQIWKPGRPVRDSEEDGL